MRNKLKAEAAAETTIRGTYTMSMWERQIPERKFGKKIKYSVNKNNGCTYIKIINKKQNAFNVSWNSF